MPALKDANSGLDIGNRRHGVRDFFVVGQVAVSLVLLVVAGLFIRSANKALNVDVGFEQRDGLVMQLDLGARGYSQPASVSFQQRLLDGARRLPGVESAALASWIPFTNGIVAPRCAPGKWRMVRRSSRPVAPPSHRATSIRCAVPSFVAATFPPATVWRHPRW